MFKRKPRPFVDANGIIIQVNDKLLTVDRTYKYPLKVIQLGPGSIVLYMHSIEEPLYRAYTHKEFRPQNWVILHDIPGQ